MKALQIYLFLVVFFSLSACKSNSQNTPVNKDASPDIQIVNEKALNGDFKKVEKSEQEWEALLSEKEFYVLRKKGTERPFTGDLLKNDKKGIYTCAACGLPLFASETKFDSGTGWPSYYKPLSEQVIKEDVDYDLGYARTEVLCARCDGHLGHVFPDGPKPTGLRYCINSVSLNFEEGK